mmetsp:Transcript_4150/g.17610  ORF Transcript_4150/g.17610 Transcript_4150/m.17610 type:complete len:222 (+) Transcript_4150:1011-1676(+)
MSVSSSPWGPEAKPTNEASRNGTKRSSEDTSQTSPPEFPSPGTFETFRGPPTAGLTTRSVGAMPRRKSAEMDSGGRSAPYLSVRKKSSLKPARPKTGLPSAMGIACGSRAFSSRSDASRRDPLDALGGRRNPSSMSTSTSLSPRGAEGARRKSSGRVETADSEGAAVSTAGPASVSATRNDQGSVSNSSDISRHGAPLSLCFAPPHCAPGTVASNKSTSRQ